MVNPEDILAFLLQNRITRHKWLALTFGAYGTVEAASNIHLLETGSSLLYPLFNLWVPAYSKVDPNVRITTSPPAARSRFRVSRRSTHRTQTGILLALAISMGETAPLLYTAGWSNYMWSGHLAHEPIGYLTDAIRAFIIEPFAEAHALAYAAALLLTMFVLIISVISRVMLQRRLD